MSEDSFQFRQLSSCPSSCVDRVKSNREAILNAVLTYIFDVGIRDELCCSVSLQIHERNGGPDAERKYPVSGWRHDEYNMERGSICAVAPSGTQ